MAEVLGVITAVVRETIGFAQSLALFPCGTAAWLVLGLSQSSLVSLDRISPFL